MNIVPMHTICLAIIVLFDSIICTKIFVLLTVHLSINLANDQLDAQLLYFIMRLLQSFTCFEKRRAHHQEVKLY